MENNQEKGDQEQPIYSSFEILQLASSKYINPYRIKYNQNNQVKYWDGIMAHSSVSCLIYNVDKRCVILVKQFRPVVYLNQVIEAGDETANPDSLMTNLNWSKVSPNEGITFELCAGICDKKKSLVETIKEELLEETGYEVDVKNIHKLRSVRIGVGLFGSLHTIFYTEVRESMKVTDGGGNATEGELIELFELKEENIKEFINDDQHAKPPGLLYALMWFLYERKNFLENH